MVWVFAGRGEGDQEELWGILEFYGVKSRKKKINIAFAAWRP
jgi:hypothetical protein